MIILTVHHVLGIEPALKLSRILSMVGLEN